jgi:hypothetical protein
MTSYVRRAIALTALAVFAMVVDVAPTFGDNVKVGAVKGATYTAVFHGETLTVKVAKNGKTATASLPDAPLFCSSGGGGPEPHSVKAGEIKKGALTTTIAFSTTGSVRKPLATVVIKGMFYKFPGGNPVFQGSAKTTLAGSEKSCNGQESFQATAGVAKGEPGK